MNASLQKRRRNAPRVAAALSLPTFSADVPQMVCGAADAENALALTDFLIDAGLVDRSDLGAQRTHWLGAAKSALERWSLRCCGGLARLTLRLTLCAEYDVVSRLHGVTLTLEADGTYEYELGTRLSKLELEAPGIGAAVLSILGGFKALPLFTPFEALCDVSQREWYGEEDEKMFLDESTDGDVERAELRESIVTRAMFDEAFPAWALSAPATVPRSAWRRWKRQGGELASIVALCLEIQSIRTKHGSGDVPLYLWNHENSTGHGEDEPELNDDRDDDCGGLFIGYAALLPWQSGDLLYRVFDDLYEYAMQGESECVTMRRRFKIGDPDKFRRCMECLSLVAAEIRLIDKLLSYVST